MLRFEDYLQDEKYAHFFTFRRASLEETEAKTKAYAQNLATYIDDVIKTADEGGTVAKCLVGDAYFYGILPHAQNNMQHNIDYVKATHFYALSAQNGSHKAKVYYAYMLYHGLGTDKNEDLAWQLLKLAQNTNLQAAYLLASQAFFKHTTSELLNPIIDLALKGHSDAMVLVYMAQEYIDYKQHPNLNPQALLQQAKTQANALALEL